MSVGRELKEHLDELYEKDPRPLVVAETGCIRSIDPGAEEGDGWSSLHIANWVVAHEGCVFHSFEIHPDNVIKAGRLMGEAGIIVDSDHGMFLHASESVEGLKTLEHIDFAYLDTSDDLQHGLEEFKVAEEKGAVMIVMDDRETKGLAALAYAKESGHWNVEERARQVIMRRK